jgi:hypothetical protein
VRRYGRYLALETTDRHSLARLNPVSLRCQQNLGEFVPATLVVFEAFGSTQVFDRHTCLFEECFEVGWCSSACRLLHLYVAEVAGQIVDSHAAHILIPLDMGEDRPPHRHFAGAMSARWLLLTRDDSFNAH